MAEVQLFVPLDNLIDSERNEMVANSLQA